MNKDKFDEFDKARGDDSGDMPSEVFRDDVWEDSEPGRTTGQDSPLAFVTNWFSGLRRHCDAEKDEKGNGAEDGASGLPPEDGDGFKDDFRRNWKKYALAGLFLLLLFNVIWTLMENRIALVRVEMSEKLAAVEEMKKDLEAFGESLIRKSEDPSAMGALQNTLTELDRELTGIRDLISGDRQVLARHEGYIRRFISDRTAELRRDARYLRGYERLLSEGVSADLPSLSGVAPAAAEKESPGPVKSTLQLTQDSLNITKDTLAITRDSLDKTRAELLKKEKDNAALASELGRARDALFSLESKMAETDRNYREQAMDLSRTKADFAIRDKETSDLKLEMAGVRESLAEKAAEIEALRASSAGKDQEIQSMEAKIAELGQSLTAREGEMASAAEEISKVRDQVVEKARALSEKTGLLEAAKKEMEELKTASAKLKDDSDKASEEKDALLAEAQSKIDELEARLNEIQGQSDKAGEELESLKQALEAKQAELDDAVRSIGAHEERQKALEERIAVLETPSGPSDGEPADEEPADSESEETPESDENTQPQE